MTITTLVQATEFVCKSLKFGIPMIQPINQERYNILKLKDGRKVLVVFKRDHFNSFGKEVEGKGHGDSINKVELDYCRVTGVNDVYIVYKEEKIYQVSIDDIMKKGKIRFNKADNKDTYSFPLTIMKDPRKGGLA